MLLHARWRRRPELCILAVVSSLMGLLYLAALAGVMHACAVALFWGGLAAAALVLGWGLARHGQPWQGFFTPGATLFVLACLGYHLAFPDVTMQLWDEFSHWGVMTKELLVTNQLPGPHGAVMFKDYPPGVNLLHYFAAVNTTPGEAGYYQGHFLLLAAPLAVFFAPLTWRRPWWIAATLLMSAALVVTLSVFVCTIMVDVVLGLFLGAGLFLALRRHLGHPEVALLAPVLFALPIIKATGSLFAWMIICLILLNSLAAWLSQRQLARAAQATETTASGPAQATPALPLGRKPLALALALALLVAAPLASGLSWKHRLVELGITASFKTQKIGLGTALKAFSSRADDKQKLIRHNFGQALLSQSLSNYVVEENRSLMAWLHQHWGLPLEGLVPGLGLVPWLGLLGLLILAGFVRHRQAPWPGAMARLWGLVLVFGAFYLVGLVLLYMFSFSEFEGPRLASYGRYVNTMLIPLALIAWGLALPGHDDPPQDQRLAGTRRWLTAACLGLFTLLLLTQAPSWPGMPKWLAKGDASEDRARITPLVEVLRQNVPTDKRVFVVYQNSSGRNFHIIRYEIAPRPTNKWFFSLGRPYFKGDVWTEPMDAAGLAKMLRDEGFDYLFLGHSDAQFWQTFGSLFSPGTRQDLDIVFKVVPNGDQGVILVPAGALPIPEPKP